MDEQRPLAESGGTAVHGAIASPPRLAIDDRRHQPLRPHPGDVKVDQYDATHSIRRSVIWAQTPFAATILSREGKAWAGQRPNGRGGILQPSEPNVALPLLEVYRRIVLDD